MLRCFLILFLLFNFKSHCQEEVIALIDQVVIDEVPNSFRFYILDEKSLEVPKIYDSLNWYPKRELLRSDPNFPFEFTTRDVESKQVNWRAFNLKKAKLFRGPNIHIKDVYIVEMDIEQKRLDSLLKNREPLTAYIRVDRKWSQEKIYIHVQNELNNDKINYREDIVYYEFSYPIFSEDGKYARISIFKQRRCDGNGTTLLYRKEKEHWVQVIDYNYTSNKVFSSHLPCSHISPNYKN